MQDDRLIALADRCEKAIGPDRALDWEIHLRNGVDGVGMYGAHPAYTASIDAALMLVPEEWTAWELYSSAKKTRFSCDLSKLTECDAGEDWAHGRGVTPALALVAASLRALADKGETE